MTSIRAAALPDFPPAALPDHDNTNNNNDNTNNSNNDNNNDSDNDSNSNNKNTIMFKDGMVNVMN